MSLRVPEDFCRSFKDSAGLSGSLDDRPSTSYLLFQMWGGGHGLVIRHRHCKSGGAQSKIWAQNNNWGCWFSNRSAKFTKAWGVGLTCHTTLISCMDEIQHVQGAAKMTV